MGGGGRGAVETLLLVDLYFFEKINFSVLEIRYGSQFILINFKPDPSLETNPFTLLNALQTVQRADTAESQIMDLEREADLLDGMNDFSIISSHTYRHNK